MTGSRFSPQQIEALGWKRIQKKSRWPEFLHQNGWYLRHCGHPTANTPWMLFDATGTMILTGIAGPARNPEFGTCWPSITEAMQYVSTTQSKTEEL